MRKLFLSLLFMFILFVPSEQTYAQTINPAVSNDAKLSFIGMTLAELIETLGAPRAVAAARGNEPWQDDVVFRYADADFFIHEDRVWQARFSSVCGISVRDRKAAVMLLLGSAAEDNGNHALLSIPHTAGMGRNWPITLRVNFNNSNQAASIFIYRPDF